MSVAGGNMSGGGASNDLIALALTGGDEFKSRLKQLMDLKKEAANEWEKLRLGKDAQKVWDEAKAKEAEVKATLEAAAGQADAIVGKAKADAAEIIRGAEVKAKALVDKASDKAAKLEADKEELLRRATHADEMAQMSFKAASQAEADVRKLKMDLDTQVKATLALQKEAEEAKAKYHEALAKLKSVAGSVLADE